MEGERWVGRFQPLQVKRFEEFSVQESPEALFWRSFKAQRAEPLAGNVTCVDFCQAEPFNAAVTSSTRVSPSAREHLKNWRVVFRAT